MWIYTIRGYIKIGANTESAQTELSLLEGFTIATLIERNGGPPMVMIIITRVDHWSSLGSHFRLYNGTTYDLNVQVYLKQNGKYKNWFLKLNGYVIGYWPGTIFNSLKDGAETVEWGGEIVNRKSQGHHTTTQMGSGHFPYEGYTKASFVSRISVMNSKKEWVSVKETNLQTKTTHPACYDVIVRPPKADLGTHFYYGGPGYSAKCK